ncbi:MAG TPA: type II secretion system F family protein [Dehalococcoidia bacterium]
MLTVLIPLTVFATVVTLVTALSGRRQPSALERLNVYRASAAAAELPPEVTDPFAERMVWPVLEGLADRLAALLPSSLLERLDEQLTRAGRPMGLRGLLLLWTASALALPAVILLALLVSGAALDSLGRILVVVTIGLGAAAPYVWLNGRVTRRQQAVVRSLPDALDMVTTCVEAGLGLDAALARVATRTQGPLAEELTRTLREINLGRQRREALRDLGDRTGVTDLQTFVNAIIQAEQMGVSVGQVLRVQSDQMRIKRRQRAEQQAYKAPVKMIFPLVLFIFPSLFVVILGPAAIEVFRTFSSG